MTAFRSPGRARAVDFGALPDNVVELMWRHARLVDGAALMSTCRRLRALLREQRVHARCLVQVGAFRASDRPSLARVVMQTAGVPLPLRERRAYTYFLRRSPGLRGLWIRADLGESASSVLRAVRPLKLSHLVLGDSALTAATITALAACVAVMAPRMLEL